VRGWSRTYGCRIDSWQMPASKTKQDALALDYGRTTPRRGREGVKRREKTDEGGDGLPPASIRLTSPDDTDARWAAKRLAA
jgi:hypothetical protein